MGRYPLRRGIDSRVSGRYPTFIAHTDSCARPKRSYRLRSSLFRQVFAACRHSLLRVGPSRRYLCESFSGCLDPYPGGSSGAFTRSFPEDIGLYQLGSGSALNDIRTATSVQKGFRGCSHSLMFRPPDLLATQVAPTAEFRFRNPRQPWLLRPRISRFVTSPSSGYASRPNRAIDGVGTFTPPDPQPCRPLLPVALLPSLVTTDYCAPAALRPCRFAPSSQARSWLRSTPTNGFTACRMRLHMVSAIGSEGAAAPVCPQYRAYGSVHGSSRKPYPMMKLKPVR
jgi:hypothetical protein